MNKMNYKSFLNIPFLICAAVLLVSASCKTMIDKITDRSFVKQALPLQKPLELIDENSLGRYKIIRNSRIENDDVVEELGTHDYLQCLLEDTQASDQSPVKYCSLFITYYTGDPDTVPHVPDECYVGSGSIKETSELIEFTVKNALGDASDPSSEHSTVKLKASRIVFRRPGTEIWDTAAKFSRLYFFKVNGQYSGSRNATRAIMSKNLWGKYSYFSKFEWEFYGASSRPDREQIIQASTEMLSTVLPVIERDHWPDWDKANSEQNDDNENITANNVSDENN